MPGPDDENSVPPDEYVLPSELLDRVPEEEREEFKRKLSAFGFRITREEHYSGPLQPSKEAERWDALVPGSAERNFNLYEQQQVKRMEAQDRILAITEEKARYEMETGRQQHKDSVALTNTELKNNADEVRRGQQFAFIVVIGIIAGGFAMIHLGHDGGGIASLLVAAATVAGIFVSQFAKDRIIGPRSESARESASSDSQP